MVAAVVGVLVLWHGGHRRDYSMAAREKSKQRGYGIVSETTDT